MSSPGTNTGSAPSSALTKGGRHHHEPYTSFTPVTPISPGAGGVDAQRSTPDSATVASSGDGIPSNKQPQRNGWNRSLTPLANVPTSNGAHENVSATRTAGYVQENEAVFYDYESQLQHQQQQMGFGDDGPVDNDYMAWYHSNANHAGRGLNGGAPYANGAAGAATGAAGPGGSADNADKHGTRLCRHYARGRCTWGNECRFSHDPTTAMYDAGFDGGRNSSNGFGGRGAGRSASVGSSSEFAVVRNTSVVPASLSARDRYVGAQQQLLLAQRHAVLDCALCAKFQIRAVASSTASAGATNHDNNNSGGATTAGGATDATMAADDDGAAGAVRGQVILMNLANAPDIVISVLGDDELAEALARLSLHPRVQEGGLLYLVGEASVFWTMMRQWHVVGTTGNADWDARLMRAQAAGSAGGVDCMFANLPPDGCLSADCPFNHSHAVPRQQLQQQQQQQQEP